MVEVTGGERNLATVGIFAGLIVVMDALSNHLQGESVVLGALAILTALGMIDGGAGMIKGKERERDMLATSSLAGAAVLGCLGLFQGPWMYLEFGLMLPLLALGLAVHRRSRLGLEWAVGTTIGIFGGVFLLTDMSIGFDGLPDDPLHRIYLFGFPAFVVLVVGGSAYLFGKHWGHWALALGASLGGTYYLTLAIESSADFFFLALPYLVFAILFITRGIGTGIGGLDTMSQFFDFRVLATPTITPLAYLLGAMFVTGLGLALIARGFMHGTLEGVYTVLIGLFVLIGGNLIWRVLCEVGLVLVYSAVEEE